MQPGWIEASFQLEMQTKAGITGWNLILPNLPKWLWFETTQN
jgi:hypothetical protein